MWRLYSITDKLLPLIIVLIVIFMAWFYITASHDCQTKGGVFIIQGKGAWPPTLCLDKSITK